VQAVETLVGLLVCCGMLCCVELCCGVIGRQGGQMRWLKIDHNVAQTVFDQNKNITFTSEISSPIIKAFSLIWKNYPKLTVTQ
jgi:hypothetical protein